MNLETALKMEKNNPHTFSAIFNANHLKWERYEPYSNKRTEITPEEIGKRILQIKQEECKYDHGRGLMQCHGVDLMVFTLKEFKELVNYIREG